MEVLLAVIASLLGGAVVLGLTALPFLLAERIGHKVGLLTGHSSLRWALPAVLLLLTFAWVLAAYRTFERDCRTIPKVEVFAPPSTRPMGFKVYGESSRYTGVAFGWNAVLESGTFQFVDLEDASHCGSSQKCRVCTEITLHKQAKPPIRSSCPQHISNTSEFAVHVMPTQQIHYWWSPPIYVWEVRVEDIKSGKVLARASDLVFGGGIIGIYLRMLGGDQDFERLSCGYASAGIGPWRPSLISRPRFAEYHAADVAFVAKALGVQQ